MTVLHTKADLAAALASHRAAGETVGLVPTMGALHEGHASLVRAAAQQCDVVVVSVFVNPTQFGPHEDYDRYPRTLAADTELALSAGAALVYAPGAAQVYASTYADRTANDGQLLRSRVSAGAIAQRWEGAARAGHFDGVCTVVTKLLLSVAPDRAYFGEKDFQQLQVIRQVVADLDIPVEIVGCPTVREHDGLALSSRNRYLAPRDREVAPALYEAIQHMRAAYALGNTDVHHLRSLGVDHLAKRCGNRWDLTYLDVVDSDTLEPVKTAGGGCRIIVSGNLAGTHLIDNASIT